MSAFSRSQANRVEEARNFLKQLRFDDERCNERSALVFLALANMDPKAEWKSASNPLRRTTEIMEWVLENYGVKWAPNTRETVRRRTLHQFVAGGLVVENPDAPERPINSPSWCYQLAADAMKSIRSFRSPSEERVIKEYLIERPGLLAAYESARGLTRIPVTLPGDAKVTLSAGGQNVLIRQMIEEFCPRFTPGGRVLYVGDSAKKADGVFHVEELANLGVVLPERGRKPDLVVHMPDRNWLVLMEAASSHGPVDVKRHRDLRTLFAASTAGLVFVSCFPSRDEMRKYLSEIAWETEVWCADHPDHMIHFNGERFLGPYS